MKIINKFQDTDGCPDTVDFQITGDIDGDGIQDDNDNCPFNPETYNKFQDTDGCPDYVAGTINFLLILTAMAFLII